MQGVFLIDAKVYYVSSTTVAGLHTRSPPSTTATRTSFQSPAQAIQTVDPVLIPIPILILLV
jgi:hypothetical protein